MKKRGQVTIFLIIGFIILLIAVSLYFLRASYLQSGAEQEISKANILEQFKIPAQELDDCIDNFLFNSVILFGQQGMCFNCVGTIDYFGSKVKVYETLDIDDISVWETEFSNYIKENLPKNCSISEQGISIKYGAPLIKTNILNDEINFNIKWPITLEKSGVTSNLDEFNKGYNVRLGALNGLMQELLTIILPEKLCLNCISELAYSNNLYIETTEYNDKKIYKINDVSNSIIKETYFRIIIAK